MSTQSETMFPLPADFEIKAEIKDEYAGDPAPKKTRGRKKGSKNQKTTKQTTITDTMPVRKKRDRFNGMPEEEVVKRLLPDHLAPDLDIVIVGINPGLCAAYVGHHYAGPGNHFWKCMYLSGLIPEPLTANDDFKLLNYGIGFTNIVARTTRGSADLSRKEIKEGAGILTEKLQKYKPKIAVFNGKGIYEVFVGHKNFAIGKQPELLPGTETTVYVMPSSSARCSQLPRAVDKVPFYESLKKLRDYLRGDLKELDDSEVCFPDLELKVVKREPKQEIQDEDDNSSGMHNFSQVYESSYPPTNMHIKHEPVYNQSQYGMASNGYPSCSNAPSHNQQSSFCNSQSNYMSSDNRDNQYQMMCRSEGDNPQNFQMVQQSLGDNSYQMSRCMMQGKQSQNFQMLQGSMQSYINNANAGQGFSFQQSLQMNGLNGLSSAPIMVHSLVQGQVSQFSMGAQNCHTGGDYQQSMMNQGNYMNYQNQQNYGQGNANFNQNAQSYDNGVTFMGYTQGQGQMTEGGNQYYQGTSNFVKQEPKDFHGGQNNECCSGQNQDQESRLQQGQMMNLQNSGQPIHIKEEPKDFCDYTNSTCQSR